VPFTDDGNAHYRSSKSSDTSIHAYLLLKNDERPILKKHFVKFSSSHSFGKRRIKRRGGGEEGRRRVRCAFECRQVPLTTFDYAPFKLQQQHTKDSLTKKNL